MSIKKEVLKFLRENKKYFYEKYGIKSIKLFGSVARGEDNENSDIDLLIEFKDFKSANLRNYMGFIEEVKNVFKRKIDVATNEMIKPLLWKYIKNDLKMIDKSYPYEQIVRFRNILVHEYFGINFTIVWNVIFYELPQLNKIMKKFLKETK